MGGEMEAAANYSTGATASSEMTTAKKVLVTFDVDGTLIKGSGPASNRLHCRAFSHAFLHLFSLPHATIDAVPHHGQTDPLVLVNTLVHHSEQGCSLWHPGRCTLATEKLPELKAKMIEYTLEHAEDIGEGLHVLPGVVSLLDALSSKDNIATGLVTGNLEEIAWLKMDGLGIRKYFTVPNIGGFGSDHSDRGQLVKIAAERAEKLFPGKFDLRVHVGDTPNDIQAAEFGGALAVGVCTGVFSKKELEQASSGSAVILPDLADLHSFLGLLGIDG